MWVLAIIVFVSCLSMVAANAMDISVDEMANRKARRFMIVLALPASVFAVLCVLICNLAFHMAPAIKDAWGEVASKVRTLFEVTREVWRK